MELVTSAPAEMGPGEIGTWATRAERLGFDVIHVSETIHDPFTVAALALQHTQRVTVRTSMVLAFPRSPMITAYAAWDLAKYSAGRFQLGIASQVRGNIVGRFSAQWSEPVARLADYIRALRAIFASFQTGVKLDYVGPHYKFERLQPYFNPGPLEHPAPQIWTGAVNARMCAMAGELADGFVCHPTNSHPVVLKSRTLPALAEGASRAGRTECPQVVANPQAMTAATHEAVNAVREQRRSELAFLYSTPAYRRQLEAFGLADVGETLSAMAQRSEWGHLPTVLTDEVLGRLVPQGTYDEIPSVLSQWYSGLCTGINLPVPADEADDDRFGALVEACRQIPAAVRNSA
jgi:probable F420-dependent oxidoreductase